MPYGWVGGEMMTPCQVLFQNHPLSGGDTAKSAGSWPSTFPAHGKVYGLRSGTNASGKKGTLFKRPPGTFVRVAVRVPKGPRLPYKVWSKRLKKYVWAREPIWIYKLKRVKSQVSSIKGLDLPPNRLSYSTVRAAYYGGDDGKGNGKITCYHPQNNYASYRSHSGALWTNFLLNGSTSSTIGTDPSKYITRTVSSRFDSALSELAPKALSKLYGEVKNQPVNFAQALAERAQTSGLILDLTSRLVRAVMKAKHGNLAGAASILFPKNSKELASDILVTNYGIRPLISDIKGCISLLTSEPQTVFDVIARRTKKLPRELISSSTTNGGTCETKVWSEGIATVLYKCRVRVSDPFGQFLGDTGFSDLPLLAWELLPYSFVADWLIPIGNYLQNKGAFANLEIVHLHRTDFCKEIITMERRFIPGKDNNGYEYMESKTVGYTATRVKCNRSILTSVPDLPFPAFKDPLSLAHITNAIALLRQLRK